MKIWIMRHGEAGFNAPSDSQRSLTPNGELMAHMKGLELGEQFRQQNILLDKIIVSPYLRAKQTAEQLVSGLQAADFSQNFAKITEEWAGITPNGDVGTVIDYLAFLQEEGAKNILIVSHLPLVFELTQALSQYQMHINFYPAVVAEIEWAGR